MKNRIFNFNAGPAALPLCVLEKIKESFINFNESGMSITEISHRSKFFDDVINSAVLRTKRLLKLDDSYHVLFFQGGASMQFCIIPMNFLHGNKTADYVNTGTWSTKAIKEAQLQNKKIKIIASSEDKNFSYIPNNIHYSHDAAYIHITSNNTIKGTQWSKYPDTGNIPLIADMSSDIMSRPFDSNKFDLIYAGAQKNIGPAGVCLVIIKADMLKNIPDTLPTMLNYKTFVSKNSMYNTPPCFAIYTVELVLKWLEESIGGLEKMHEINKAKAQLLYTTIDSSDFYSGTSELKSRSLMNVTFKLKDEETEKLFIQKALENGLGGLKGHRSIGGCRASIYNATDYNAVKTLTDFMKDFEQTYG